MSELRPHTELGAAYVELQGRLVAFGDTLGEWRETLRTAIWRKDEDGPLTGYWRCVFCRVEEGSFHRTDCVARRLLGPQ